MWIFYLAFWVLMIGTLIWMSTMVEECPREMLGYNCKGEKCDHSKEEIKRVKEREW